jgi:hypothetical protein
VYVKMGKSSELCQSCSQLTDDLKRSYGELVILR